MDAFVDHAAHLWAELRVIRDYTKQQTDALNKIREIYLTCFEITPDDLQRTVLAIDKDMKAPTITKQQCEEKLKSLLKRVLADNPLTPFVNDIVVTVQEYYRIRMVGVRKVSFYVNDPRSLMCILLLEYIHEVLKPERNIDTIATLQRWMRFFKQIRLENVFPVRETASSAADTISSMLLNIEHKLEMIVEYIRAELKERTIAEHLDSLITTGRNTIDGLFIYLAHALSGQQTPLLSVGSFYNPILASSMQDWLSDNYHASLMASLACHPSVKRIIGVCDGSPPMGSEVSTFLSMDCAPADREVELYRLCKNTASFFRGDTELAAAVLRTFGYVAVLSELLLCCKEASFLAKMVGEILLCWNEVASRILTGLMATVREVLRMLRNDMGFIKKELEKTQLRLSQKLGKEEAEEMWKSNYKVVHAMEHAILEADKIGKMDQICLVVQQHLSNPEARVQETKTRLGVFVQSVQSLFTRVKWLPQGQEVLRLADAFSVMTPAQLMGQNVHASSPRNLRSEFPALPSAPPSSGENMALTPVPTHPEAELGGEQRSSTELDWSQMLSPKTSYNENPQFQPIAIDLSPFVSNVMLPQCVFTAVSHIIAIATFRNRFADIVLFKRQDGTRIGTLRAGDRPIRHLNWLSETHLQADDGDSTTYVWDIFTMKQVSMMKGAMHVNHHHQLYVLPKIDGCRHAAELFNIRTLTTSVVGPKFSVDKKTSTYTCLYDITPTSSHVLTGSLYPKVSLNANQIQWVPCFLMWDTNTNMYEPLQIIPNQRELPNVMEARFVNSQYFYLLGNRVLKIYEVSTGAEWYTKVTTQGIAKVFVVNNWLVVIESPPDTEDTTSMDSTSSRHTVTLTSGIRDFSKVWLMNVRKKIDNPIPFPANYVSVECTMDGKLIALLSNGKFVMFPLF